MFRNHTLLMILKSDLQNVVSRQPTLSKASSYLPQLFHIVSNVFLVDLHALCLLFRCQFLRKVSLDNDHIVCILTELFLQFQCSFYLLGYLPFGGLNNRWYFKCWYEKDKDQIMTNFEIGRISF